MENVNSRKRAVYGRRVQAALQEILNDPGVMPNVDASDLMVSVTRVEFGRTVRQILIEVSALWRRPGDGTQQERHDRYLREAKARGESTYLDLDDVLSHPKSMESVAEALQARLGLVYRPEIKLLTRALRPEGLAPPTL